MTDYQGNSNKLKEEAKKQPKKDLEKVVKGDVIVKQPTLGSRVKNIFFGGDLTSAREYVLSEVLLPAFRNLLVESISKGTDRLIYGEGARRRPPVNYGSRFQYNNPIARTITQERAYLPNQRPMDRWASPTRRAQEDVIVQSKADADMVVENLVNIVDQYEVVSLGDLNELLGLPTTHIDNKFGWTHLGSIEVRQVREGWRISFPPLEDIS